MGNVNIQAAQRQDSLALSRLSASPQAVAWGLRAARQQPDSLAAWAGRVEAWTGPRTGDTTEVLVLAAGVHCEHKPIVLRFVGNGEHLRIWSASSQCLDMEDSISY